MVRDLVRDQRQGQGDILLLQLADIPEIAIFEPVGPEGEGDQLVCKDFLTALPPLDPPGFIHFVLSAGSAKVK